MEHRKIIFLVFFLLFSPSFSSTNSIQLNSSSLLHGIELPPFNAAATDTGCDGRLAETANPPSPLKLYMKNSFATEAGGKKRKDSFLESAKKDAARIDTMHERVQLSWKHEASPRRALSERLVATVESGVAVGSGEYLVDMYIGTPARHFQLIMDTGSDLNWLQCAPCRACFEQRGAVFDPSASSSYRNVTCGDRRCGLVSAPVSPRPCRRPGDPCPYYYWYGDRSNTTGDLALEAFTVNLTAPVTSRRVDDVVFGCGHWNRGLFHGAAGLLGLGRGSLSFASQLRSLYGHAFSYCLVDHSSDISVSSKIIFGEDRDLLAHPQLNYTAFVAGTGTPADTFYYIRIKSVVVGGDVVNIPAETWEVAKDGSGGTIIDSGTTLSYFADPAYQLIRQAFIQRVNAYPLVADFPMLNPCYNVSGVDRVELPEFSIVFADGATWDFPAENYFIRLDPEEVVCLAILGTPRSGLSIIGNYQQQNFHVLYDLEKARLGFAPRQCAEV